MEHTAVGSGKYLFLSFLQILVCCAVNIYGITTGYLLCRKQFGLARLTKLWLTTVFWSVSVSCCVFLLDPASRTISETVSMFLPILRGRYWFFTAYFVVMLISPVLNLVIDSLSRRQFHLLFAVLFVIFGVVPVCSLGYDVLRISTGHHFSWMIVLYLIGGYLQKMDDETISVTARFSGRWLAGYFAFAAVHLLYKYLVPFVGLEGYVNLLQTYPSPLILGEAICLFLFFKNSCKNIPGESMTGKVMGFISPGVYSVYIIHVHPKVYWNDNIVALFRQWDGWNAARMCLAMLGTALAVFVACVLLDALRQRLFRFLRIDQKVERLSDRAEQFIRSRIY